MAASGTSLTVADQARRTDEGLPSLFSRLGDDVMALVNSQLALFKVEVKEEATAYAHGAIMIGLGVIVAAIGFALLNVAVAFGVSVLFANANLSQPAAYALGFVVAGAFYLIVGGLVVLTIKNRLAKRSVLPTRTVAELRKDKEWLKNEL
ncbi:MAG TPA: phage holin family protein [Pyrinomonadaceae bacterium]|nr:phage holin family protein [Pyrinomonadaceae bacterium]